MERLTQCIDGKVDPVPYNTVYLVTKWRVTLMWVSRCVTLWDTAVCWGGVIIWSINTASNVFSECVRGSISFLDLDNETICILGSLQSVRDCSLCGLRGTWEPTGHLPKPDRPCVSVWSQAGENWSNKHKVAVSSHKFRPIEWQIQFRYFKVFASLNVFYSIIRVYPNLIGFSGLWKQWNEVDIYNK